jgi:hypothetical protein
MDLGLETTEPQAAQLAAIDQATLTPLVQSAAGSNTVEVVNWESEQLHGGIAAGTAVYRFSGQGRDQGRTMPWSLILKLLRSGVGSADPSSWDYYKREVDAYQSGWLDELPGGLAAPRCYGALDHPDGTCCWMWLEDIRDIFASQWSLEHHGVAARHLGHFGGAYLVDRVLPSSPWLSSGWLRHYVEQSTPVIEPLRDAVKLPWGRRWLPEEDREQYFRLWAERDLYLDALDGLPQTICHFDIFSLNMFARKTEAGDDQTVVIDWAFVGRGPIGADLNPLVLMSIAIGGVAPERMQELEKIALEGYVQGLHEAGWHGDPRQVRLGYTAAGVRYLFPELERWLGFMLDESLHAEAEQRLGMSMGATFDGMVWLRRQLFRMAGEARDIISILG